MLECTGVELCGALKNVVALGAGRATGIQRIFFFSKTTKRISGFHYDFTKVDMSVVLYMI